jgi:hypothetical protein
MPYKNELDVTNDILLFRAIQRAVARHLETGERVGVYITQREGQCDDVCVCAECNRDSKTLGPLPNACCYGVAWNGAFYFTPIWVGCDDKT